MILALRMGVDGRATDPMELPQQAEESPQADIADDADLLLSLPDVANLSSARKHQMVLDHLDTTE